MRVKKKSSYNCLTLSLPPLKKTAWLSPALMLLSIKFFFYILLNEPHPVPLRSMKICYWLYWKQDQALKAKLKAKFWIITKELRMGPLCPTLVPAGSVLLQFFTTQQFHGYSKLSQQAAITKAASGSFVGIPRSHPISKAPGQVWVESLSSNATLPNDSLRQGEFSSCQLREFQGSLLYSDNCSWGFVLKVCWKMHNSDTNKK